MPNAEFESFYGALVGQESGGNYRAVNARTGASGIGQIMPGNVGPWSQKYLGQKVSLAQYRADPALQDRLARAVLQDYYNKYGLRGAASAWYSGNPAKANNYTKFRSNEPSIGQYVDSVLGKMGKARAPYDAAAAQAIAVGTTTRRGTSSALSSVAVAQPKADRFQTVDPTEVTSQAVGLAGVGAGVELGLDKADGAGAVGQKIGETTETTTQYRMPDAPSGTTTTTGAAGGFTPGQTGNALRQAAIAKASQYLGTPYRWGGSQPGGFDCSGLLQYSLGSIGIKLPRVSQQQDRVGPRIALSAMKPGDLIGFNGSGHIAMYVGNGQMIEAPRTGLNVRIVPVRGNFGVDMSRFYGG